MDFGFLDFSTLEKRRRACEEEVRLNRRTCTSIYLGVVPIVEREGRYRLGGDGIVVDHAVHMRRLPAARMMDRMLDAGEVDHSTIGRLATFVADFHHRAETSAEITRGGGHEEFERHLRDNLDQVRPFVRRTVPLTRFRRIESLIAERLPEFRPLILAREAEGRVRDCHGDLRSDAVCFDPRSDGGICIFDCIEFSERYRWSDTGLDVGFLAMDLHFRGHETLADLFVGLYAAYAGDSTLPAVLPPYKAYRAFVRGKVEGLLIDDPHVLRREKAAAKARAARYFRLSESYLRFRNRRQIVLVMGVSGSGKSVLAGTLASRLGAVLLSTDMMRNELAGTAVGERERPPLDAGIYKPEERTRVYAALVQRAEKYALQGHAVVLDGTFLEPAQRAGVLELAALLKRELIVVEATAPPHVIEARQRLRENEPWTTSEGRWEVALEQLRRYHPPEEVPPASRRLIDTTAPLEDQLSGCL